MKIDRVTYKQKFPTGSFLNCDIGFEASIGENENPEEAMKALQDLAESFHKSSFSHLYTESGSPVTVVQVEEEPIVKMTNDEKKQLQVNNFVEAISTCTSLKALEIFRKLVERENLPILTETFENKLKEFPKE